MFRIRIGSGFGLVNFCETMPSVLVVSDGNVFFMYLVVKVSIFWDENHNLFICHDSCH